MRNISKYEHCKECAAKCLNQASSMSYAVIMAPSPIDFEHCVRKHRRAVRHYLTYKKLMAYYGGNR